MVDIGSVELRRHGRAATLGRRALASLAEVAPQGDNIDLDAQALSLDLRQKFGRMGLRSHKRVGTPDLFRILRVARSPEDYSAGLHAMNVFFNYGVKLRHRELASRLVACAMACGKVEEAVDMVKFGGAWLEHPPDTALVYALMGHFLDAGQPLVVRDLAKAVREDWRMKVEPPLYILAIEAMLRLPEADGPLEEALAIYDDALAVGARLPAPLHLRIFDGCLQAAEAASPPPAAAAAAAEGGAIAAGGEAAADGETAATHIRVAVRVADALAQQGHLRGGASAAMYCSLAWLHRLLAALPDGARASALEGRSQGGALDFLGGNWVRLMEAAMDHFGCNWGFSSRLPRGFFRSLEAVEAAAACPEAARLVPAARRRFGRFYPEEGVAA